MLYNNVRSFIRGFRLLLGSSVNFLPWNQEYTHLIKLEFESHDVAKSSGFTLLHVQLQQRKKEVFQFDVTFKRVQEYIQSFVGIKVKPTCR